MNIKTRKIINESKDKLINTWYFTMKPLAKFCDYITDNNYKKLKTKTWNEKRIRKELNKQIQRLVIRNNKTKNEKNFYLIDKYIYDVQRDFNGMYNVNYFFNSSWQLLKNEYLSKYISYGFKGNDQEFIDNWLPIIIDICEENDLVVAEINKDDLCPNNKYWKYDNIYKKLNRVWKVE